MVLRKYCQKKIKMMFIKFQKSIKLHKFCMCVCVHPYTDTFIYVPHKIYMQQQHLRVVVREREREESDGYDGATRKMQKKKNRKSFAKLEGQIHLSFINEHKNFKIKMKKNFFFMAGGFLGVGKRSRFGVHISGFAGGGWF